MSHKKDTDYLSISTRVRAMESRMLDEARLTRLIDATSNGEVWKILQECGYGQGEEPAPAQANRVLEGARAEVMEEIRKALPDPSVVEVFQLKYDYHNAKVLLKARGMGVDGNHLLLEGGRYAPAVLAEGVQTGEYRGIGQRFVKAMLQAGETLDDTHDPQMSDLVLDRACYEEMSELAKASQSKFLEGYVKLSVDVANLRTAVRVARMEKNQNFLRQVLLPGGNVSPEQIAATSGEDLASLFQTGELAQAAELGAKAARPAAGSLTAFERECDNGLTSYMRQARRIPFGEEPVIAYLYAKEAELTAIRTILAGRRAGLSKEVIQERLREVYG